MNGFASIRGFVKLRLQRLRTGLGPAFVFGSLGILCRNVEMLPAHIYGAQKSGFAASFMRWIVNGFLVSCVVATIVLLAIRVSAPSGKDMTRRPLRFFGVLLLVGTIAAFAAREMTVLLHTSPAWGAPDMPWDRFYEGWVATMLWGSLFGWLYALYLQRREDQLRLATVLGQRSLLTRMLAQSRVTAARAQIEPEMVVRVLRVVHQRYGTSPDTASTLMDHLINYLRLVLNRVREQRPLLINELTLIKSYLALHEAETGRAIPFEAVAEHSNLPAESTFVIVRKLIRAANTLQGVQTSLRLLAHTDHIAIELGTGTVPFEPEQIVQISAELVASDVDGSIVHRTTGPHSHWYSINVPIH
jgi:hypothetical protein